MVFGFAACFCLGLALILMGRRRVGLVLTLASVLATGWIWSLMLADQPVTDDVHLAQPGGDHG